MKQGIELEWADIEKLLQRHSALQVQLGEQVYAISVSDDVRGRLQTSRGPTNGARPASDAPTGRTWRSRRRREHSAAFKRRVVDAVNARGDQTIRAVADRFHINRSLASAWTKGRSLRKSGKQDPYTAEFKAKALEAMKNRGDKTQAQVAKDLGLPNDSYLYRWQRQKKGK
jgi:transposase-like protein